MLNEFLELLERGIEKILSGNLIGIYAHGSLALGDFDPTTSDVDFLVVTKKMISDTEFKSLNFFHSDLTRKYPTFGTRLEGSYVPKDMLKMKNPPNLPRPYLNGKSFVWAKYGYEWILEKYVLRKYGIVLKGVPITKLIPQIEAEDLKYATVNLLNDWWNLALNNDDKLSSSEYQVYAILTMCRALYTLKYGEITSKPKAAAWAKKNLGHPWEQLIDAALNWEKDENFDHLDETKKFIEFVHSKAAQSRPLT